MKFSARSLKAPRSISFASIILSFGLVTVLLTGCQLFQNDLKIDRAGNKEFQDYRDALGPRPIPPTATAANGNADIPNLQSYVAQPADNMKSMPLVSISVNQSVPLRDALFELAKQANYDIELDPRITGSIIFTARNQPLDTVVQRISDIAGLRYKFENNVLRVELDTPYHETYKIDYLAYVRKSTSTINNNSSLATTGGGGSGGANPGSQFTATSEAEANFWGELQTNLQQILGVPTGAGNMRSDSDPQLTAVAPAPAPAPAPVVPAAVTTEGAAPAAPASAATAPSPAKAASPSGQPATLQVSSLPATSGASAPAAAATPSTVPSFSINKQGGIVSVYATERQQTQIRDYLKQLRRASTAQVLIEAKVLEVDLTDEFATGINWSKVINALNNRVQISAGNFAAPVISSASGSTGFALSVGSGSLNENAVVDAIQVFGTVKALSSPRLTVLNNQSAVLDVATNRVYYTIQAQTSQGTSTSSNLQSVTSTPHSIPEGVLINVQPSIDLDNRKISLSIRPTITRIVDSVNDPGLAYELAAANLSPTAITSPIPEVNVQEMDSVIAMGSGQAVLMGGLMQDRVDSSQTGIPVLAELPGIGALFRNQGDKISKTELVIFMKATIVDDGTPADSTDRDLYKKFGDDRHPYGL